MVDMHIDPPTRVTSPDSFLSPPTYPPTQPPVISSSSSISPTPSRAPSPTPSLHLRRTASQSSYFSQGSTYQDDSSLGLSLGGAAQQEDGHATGDGGLLEDVKHRSRRFEKSARHWLEQNMGLCLIAMSQAFFASMNASVKYLNSQGGGLPTLELVGIRMAFTLTGCVSWLFYTGDPNPFLGPPEVRHLLALRGFIGFFGLTGMYQSLQHLSLSDSTVLGFLAPTVTAMLGYAVLREPFTRKEAMAGLLSLLGVVLIARPTALFGSASPVPSQAITGSLEDVSPDFYLSRAQTSKMGMPEEVVQAGERLAAVAFAMMGVCGSSGAYITIRAIGNRAKPFHSIAYFSFWCVVVSIIGMIVLRQPVVLPNGILGWFLIVVIGVFGLGAQVLVTMGLQREKAGRGSLAMYTQLLFAAFIERIFFHVVPTFMSILGTVIILGSALWVAFSNDDSKSSSPRHRAASGGYLPPGTRTPALEAGGYIPLAQLPDSVLGEPAINGRRTSSGSVLSVSGYGNSNSLSPATASVGLPNGRRKMSNASLRSVGTTGGRSVSGGGKEKS